MQSELIAMKYLLSAWLLLLVAARVSVADTVTFEGLLTGAEEFYNGDSGIGNNSNGWSADGVFFNNSFSDFGGGFTGWTGWSYANITDNATPGFGNQYSAFPGGGSDGTGAPGGVNVGQTYAIAFADDAYFNLPDAMMIQSADLTNTTYAGLSMRDGDAFAKPFGGASGNDPDFFRVTFTGFAGLDMTGGTTGALTFDLADYTFVDNSQDFIIGDWVPTDLTALGNARSVGLSFASSDVGAFGINTPTYVALDNLTLASAVPEPGSAGMFAAASLIIAYRLRRKWWRRLVPNRACDRGR